MNNGLSCKFTHILDRYCSFLQLKLCYFIDDMYIPFMLCFSNCPVSVVSFSELTGYGVMVPVVLVPGVLVPVVLVSVVNNLFIIILVLVY